MWRCNRCCNDALCEKRVFVGILYVVVENSDVVVVQDVLVIMVVVVVVFERSRGCAYVCFGGGTCARNHCNRGVCCCAQSHVTGCGGWGPKGRCS